MSHSHVAHSNESCHTYEWVMSCMRMRHVKHMNESCHTYIWVMSHMWMGHVTYTNESCHTNEWVVSNIWMSHVMSHVYIHECDMTHSYMWYDSFIFVTWLIHIFDMTHSYISHDSFISVTWLIQTSHVSTLNSYISLFTRTPFKSHTYCVLQRVVLCILWCHSVLCIKWYYIQDMVML